MAWTVFGVLAGEDPAQGELTELRAQVPGMPLS